MTYVLPEMSSRRGWQSGRETIASCAVANSFFKKLVECQGNLTGYSGSGTYKCWTKLLQLEHL